jgi:hypothetical protein
MSAPSRVNGRMLTGAVLMLGGAWAWGSAVADGPKGQPASTEAAPAEARVQAKLLHAVYASTLDAMHHHFFRSDRAVLPARALEDVFADVARQTKARAKWIAVNTRPMNIDHEPTSDFEKQAARALSAGKNEFARTEDGYYHRAAAIPLTSGCVSCHMGFLAKAPSSPRFAGLVISIPLAKD